MECTSSVTTTSSMLVDCDDKSFVFARKMVFGASLGVDVDGFDYVDDV